MTIHQVRSMWSGFQGAPGYTNFYFSSVIGEEAAGAAIQAVNTFWNAVIARIAHTVTITVEDELTVIDEATGQIQGYELGDVEGATVTSSGTSGYSATSGAVITWDTDGVRAGRRIRGRTFLVPLDGMSYQSDGTLGTATLNDLRDAASDFVTNAAAPELCVWSRPRGSTSGQFAPVTGSRVPDMAAVLRSRRD